MPVFHKLPYNSGTRVICLPGADLALGPMAALGGVGCDGSPLNPRFTLFAIRPDGGASILGTVEDAERLAGSAGFRFRDLWAFVACSMVDRLTVVDVSNPLHPSVVGSVQDHVALRGAYDVEIIGDMAFVTGDLGRLTVVDLHAPTHPVVVGSSSPFQSLPWKVFLWDQSTGLFTENPTVFGSDPFDLTAVGDCLYVGHPEMFSSVRIPVTKPATGRVTAFGEYFNGATWEYLPLGFVYGADDWYLAEAGEIDVHWSNLNTDWAPTIINGFLGYWIRFRLTSILESEAPVQARADRFQFYQDGHPEQQMVYCNDLNYTDQSLDSAINDVPVTSDPPVEGDHLLVGNPVAKMGRIYHIHYSTPGAGYYGTWYFLNDVGEWERCPCPPVGHGWSGDTTNRFKWPNSPGDYVDPNMSTDQYSRWTARMKDPAAWGPSVPFPGYWLMLYITSVNTVPTPAEFGQIMVHWSEPGYAEDGPDLHTLKLVDEHTILATGHTHIVKFSIVGGFPSLGAELRDELHFHHLKGFDVSGGRAFIANQQAAQLVVLDLDSMDVVGTLTDEEELDQICDVRMVGDQAVVVGGQLGGGGG